MDSRKDGEIAILNSWPIRIPVNGFEWIEGIQWIKTRRSNVKSPNLFLVQRSGPLEYLSGFREDLFEDFANLNVERDSIVRFANKHGSLFAMGVHFHKPDGDESFGDPSSDWGFIIKSFQETLQLWHLIRDARKRSIKQFLYTLASKGGFIAPPRVDYSVPPSASIDQAQKAYLDAVASIPTEQAPGLATAVVIEALNKELASRRPYSHPCAFPKCSQSDTTFSLSGETRVEVRRHKQSGAPHLQMMSTDLRSTVWLQLSDYVCGKKRLKQCEASDCGKWIDVKRFYRPGAHRMHPRCEERIRKQRYRLNKRKQG